jgi:hypothetical protein
MTQQSYGQNDYRLEQEPGAMSDAVIIEASLIARRKGNGLLLARLICSPTHPLLCFTALYGCRAKV